MWRTCKAPATLVGEWRHCEACEQLPPEMREPDSNLDKTLSRHIASLTIANNEWRYDLAPKEAGDAKRRKRA